MNTYVAITPARDEEKLITGLISSLAAQTVSPNRWIVIDDGSSDRTGEILDRAVRDYPWTEAHHLPRNRARAAGGESVIMRFLPRDIWERYNFVVRLDADLTFGADFVELLLREFARDPHLGIAGATLLEPSQAGWSEVRQPAFHTRGAAKMYSRTCFAAIGGLNRGLGWDTLDEARAMMLGFRTSSFRHIRAYHHRPQGSAGGIWRSRVAAGRAAYQVGYSPVFMVARAGRRMLDRPPVVGGIALLAGFFEGYLRRQPRAASKQLVKFVRKQQLRRLLLMESQWR
jgi:biofilm PGA synthesis N-glycosyltransferase PgaC